MLSQKDLDEIEELIEEKLDEKIKHLPTKDEFYTRMDELIGEVKAMREEQRVITGKISEHTDTLEDHESRITSLEHPLSQSS
jgi:vacuolar-type H+-ATPase subunit E/Vma4